MASAKDALRASLLAQSTSSSSGSKEPDGVLTPTPDTAGEYRSSSQCLDCVPTTSTYLEDDDDGRKPNELFGKFTWKIDKFSEIGKRELRSAQFDVGDYKWYILVYPQGCDVCNHLSLFLCVADYDKLLPGWSHFAQFTIAVVNKDAKKSKYSDTLHRFCKKEHDWGWKKFMELSKVMDGFTVADTLVIKAQVQVILDKPGRPFRCLDAQYRRELVRVYLTNVESICRRFCDDKRARLAWLRSEAPAFREWWEGLGAEKRRLLIAERGEVVLKGVVKQFFNEKEVTSTLVMDALYAGCRQLEEASRNWAADPASVPAPNVIIHADRNVFTFGADLLDVAERSACPDWIPPYREDKGALGADGLALRSGGPESGPEGEARRDSVDRDERRLGELGKRTVEMLAIAHIFTEKLESEYRQYQALKRQDALIAEEEEAGRLEDERQAARQQAEKERRAKKKEKQKKRKEEERLKREAEEEERRRAEEERRREAEARAEEKRRQEQEEREREAEAAAAVAQRERQRRQQQEQQQQAAAPPAAATSASGRGSGGELRSHVLASQNGRQSGSVSPDCSSSDASDLAAPQQTSRKGSPAPAAAAAAAASESAPPPAATASRDAGGVADQAASGRGGAAASGASSASAAAATAAAPAAGPAAAALAAELESHKRRVADLEDQVAILQQHNRMHEASASSSGRQLGDLQRQVADLSRALAERDRAIEVARRRTATLQQQLEARDALIAELRRGGGAASAAARSGDGGAGARPRSSSGESSEPQEGGEGAGGDAVGSAGAGGAAKGFLNGTGAAWGGAAAAASAAAIAAAAAARAGSGDAEVAPPAGENGGSGAAARQGLRGAPGSYSDVAVGTGSAGPAAPSGGGAAPAGSGTHSRTPSLSASAGPSPASGPQPSAQVHPADLSIGPSALSAAAGGAAAGQPLVRSGSAGAAGFRGPTKGGSGAAGSSTRFAGAAAAAQGAVAQNGVAGVLHSSVPVSAAGAQSQQPTTPSYRTTAASASGAAASGASAAARPGSAAATKGASSMAGIGLGAKGGAAAAAFGAFGGPQAYGGMAAGAGKAAGGTLSVGGSPGGAASPAAAGGGGQRTAAPAQAMDDGGAEFLHMSMIDSLLQE